MLYISGTYHSSEILNFSKTPYGFPADLNRILHLLVCLKKEIRKNKNTKEEEVKDLNEG